MIKNQCLTIKPHSSLRSYTFFNIDPTHLKIYQIVENLQPNSYSRVGYAKFRVRLISKYLGFSVTGKGWLQLKILGVFTTKTRGGGQALVVKTTRILN